VGRDVGRRDLGDVGNVGNAVDVDVSSVPLCF
jgi:hypothetical protein